MSRYVLELALASVLGEERAGIAAASVAVSTEPSAAKQAVAPQAREGERDPHKR